jgi:hypothetical protein
MARQAKDRKAMQLAESQKVINSAGLYSRSQHCHPSPVKAKDLHHTLHHAAGRLAQERER